MLRLSAGIRGSTLVINFPGSAKACDECLTIVEPVLGHAIDQLRADTTSTALTHQHIQQQLKSRSNYL
jgi:molybdopterin biosynthesis enzyme MoaB